MVSRVTQTINGTPGIRPAGLRNQSFPGGSPTSLDTLHQSGIFQQILPWSWGAHRPLPGFSREDLKAKLADSLDHIGYVIEAENVRACQKEFYVVPCSRCGLPVAYPHRCRNRLCPDCASATADLLIKEHSDQLKQIRYPRMVGLTWPSVKKITRGDYIKGRKDLTKLRHQKVWSSVKGGIGSFETTYSKVHGWHLHWHGLIDSSYIPQADLSKAWERITGASVVDIRLIKNDNKWDGIREVVKYPAKAVNFIGDPALVKEYLEAVKGLKLVHGFGWLSRISSKRYGDNNLVCPRCGSTEFDWQNKITVASDRVYRWGDTWVLRDNLIRGSPHG